MGHKRDTWTVDGRCLAGLEEGDSLISGQIHFLIAHSRLPRFLPLPDLWVTALTSYCSLDLTLNVTSGL